MKLSSKIIVVVPEYDQSTIEAIAKFDCKSYKVVVFSDFGLPVNLFHSLSNSFS